MNSNGIRYKKTSVERLAHKLSFGQKWYFTVKMKKDVKKFNLRFVNIFLITTQTFSDELSKKS